MDRRRINAFTALKAQNKGHNLALEAVELRPLPFDEVDRIIVIRDLKTDELYETASKSLLYAIARSLTDEERASQTPDIKGWRLKLREDKRGVVTWELRR